MGSIGYVYNFFIKINKRSLVPLKRWEGLSCGPSRGRQRGQYDFKPQLGGLLCYHRNFLWEGASKQAGVIADL